MTKKVNILLIVLVALLTATRLSSAADQWADVKSAGVLRFGVAPDYYPFVYTEGTDLDGLDIALVKEMGSRLGIEIKPINMAFDGLIDAILIDQVDLIGGGFSITDERLKSIDYTNAYYQAGGVILCRAGNPVTEENIRNFKLGVLKGTSFEQWVATNLLMGGKISPINIFTFSKNEDTIRALKDGQVDMVLIDEDVYRSQYKNDSSIILVNSNVMNEKYAYGAQKGSTLIPELNNVMREMFKDGTAQKIADEYFARDYSDRIAPSITRPVQAYNPVTAPAEDIVISREVSPAEVEGPRANNQPGCRNGMMFVSDVSIPDRTVLLPNMSATKTWNIQNTGTCTWDSTYSFNYVKGSVFGPTSVKITKLVAPGEKYEVSVPFTTPASNGEYTAWWQMRGTEGNNFGQTIWYDFLVNGTSGSSDQKVSQGTPQILKWYPDFYSTDNGKCPKTYYQVTNAYQVEFYINNQYVDSSRNLSGYTYLCPPKKSGTYTFGIVAVGETRTSTAYNFIDSTNYASPAVGVNADWPHWTQEMDHRTYGLK
ncbi:MAG: transporter substrate-binding domain-containing protein [Flexilinea sp.]|nr:transporter substrate-binding domain-containing protein [Flexilinea sp.]